LILFLKKKKNRRMPGEYDSIPVKDSQTAVVEMGSFKRLKSQRAEKMIEEVLTPGATLTKQASRNVIRFVTGADEETDPELKKFMMQLDEDGDGQIDEKELHHMMRKYYESEHLALMLKRILVGLVVLAVVLLICLSCMTWRVVENSKETKLHDDVMTSKGSGNAAQCANTDMHVEGGVIVPRSNGGRRLMDANGRNLISKDVNGNQLVDAIATRQHKQEVLLTSSLPDKYFEELTWLRIFTPTGLSVSLKIQGISRLLTRKAKCGTLLQIVTTAGLLVLDDADIYYDKDLFGIFTSAGFDPITSADTTTIVGRRLQSSSQTFSISGFFNTISTYDWQCKSVAKPSLPDSFVMETSVYTLCSNSNACGINALPNSGVSTVAQFGVTTIPPNSGGDYYLQTSRQYVVSNDGSYSHTVTSPLYRPGVKSVSITTGDGDITSFQTESDGSYSHCKVFHNVEPPTLNLPSDYFFYPIDDAIPSSNLMHFRISYRANPTDLDIAFGINPEWIHIDYFEDKTTHVPKVLISGQGDIIEINSISEYTPAAQIKVDASKLTRCGAVTEFAEDPNFSVLVSIMTDPVQLKSLDVGSDLKTIAAYWDWTKTYPPLDNGPATYTVEKDFEYYFARGSAAGVPKDWVEWANNNYKYFLVDPAKRPLPVPKTRALDSKEESFDILKSIDRRTLYVTNNDFKQNIRIGSSSTSAQKKSDAPTRRKLFGVTESLSRKLATSNPGTWFRKSYVSLNADNTSPRATVIGGNFNWNMTVNLLPIRNANISASGDGTCVGSICLSGKLSAAFDFGANPAVSPFKDSLFKKSNFGNDVTFAAGSLQGFIDLAELYNQFRTSTNNADTSAVFGNKVALGLVEYTVRRGSVGSKLTSTVPYVYKQSVPDYHKIGRTWPINLGLDGETSLAVQGSFQFEMQVPNDKLSYLCSTDDIYLQDCSTYTGTGASSLSATYKKPVIPSPYMFPGFAKSSIVLQYRSQMNGLFSDWQTVSNGTIFDMAFNVIEQLAPTNQPTTLQPSAAPSKIPSSEPTPMKTSRPQNKPTQTPSTDFPTERPTSPSERPTISTVKPSTVSKPPYPKPTNPKPTQVPSTLFPTEHPSDAPTTKEPSAAPTTKRPTKNPSIAPIKPTKTPVTAFPTDHSL